MEQKMKFLLVISLLIFGITGQTKTLKLDETNTLRIFKEINYGMVPDFLLNLARLNEIDTKKPIYLYIHSPGGSVVVSEMLIEMAQKSRRPVHTVAIHAASAAFNVVQSLGIRYVTSFSRLLTHHAYTNFFPLNPGSIADAKQGMALVTPIYERIAKRMKLSNDEYELLMDKDLYIKGADNIKVNSADEVVDVDCSRGLILAGNCPN
jgi:ATP-dependent protease ClpP protease subunit